MPLSPCTWSLSHLVDGHLVTCQVVAERVGGSWPNELVGRARTSWWVVPERVGGSCPNELMGRALTSWSVVPERVGRSCPNEWVSRARTSWCVVPERVGRSCPCHLVDGHLVPLYMVPLSPCTWSLSHLPPLLHVDEYLGADNHCLLAQTSLTNLLEVLSRLLLAAEVAHTAAA